MQSSDITMRGSGCFTASGQHHFEDRGTYDWCRQCGLEEPKVEPCSFWGPKGHTFKKGRGARACRCGKLAPGKHLT